MQVYLPADLYAAVKERHLSASDLLQKAVRSEVRRRELEAASRRYTAGLVAEVGQPTPSQRARAAGIARRIAGHVQRKAGWQSLLVLDSGAVTSLAERPRDALALIVALRNEGWWPPVVPAVMLVECLRGHAGRDANENRLLKTCDVAEVVPEALARRAALLRRLAGRG
jgi:hypothetical protein